VARRFLTHWRMVAQFLRPAAASSMGALAGVSAGRPKSPTKTAGRDRTPFLLYDVSHARDTLHMEIGVLSRPAARPNGGFLRFLGQSPPTSEAAVRCEKNAAWRRLPFRTSVPAFRICADCYAATSPVQAHPRAPRLAVDEQKPTTTWSARLCLPTSRGDRRANLESHIFCVTGTCCNESSRGLHCHPNCHRTAQHGRG
jgi:hypothetical protein